MRIKTKITFLLVFFIVSASALSVGAVSFPLLISEYFMLEKDYQPQETIDISKHTQTTRSPLYMEYEAAQNFILMMNDCKAAGIKNAAGQSGLRSYSYQQQLFSNKVKKLKKSGMSEMNAYIEGKKVVALPGASEHQSGLAIDISVDNTLTERFASTKAGIWLSENSYKYGFVLRYPKDKTHITGIVFEPWHFRYVGKVHATIMKNQNLCLEEYYLEYGLLSHHPLSQYLFEQLALDKLSKESALSPDSPISIAEFLKLLNVDNTSFNESSLHLPVTRVEAAVILCEKMGLDLSGQFDYNFPDTVDCSETQKKALSAMFERFFFCTFDQGIILPFGTITVAQASNIACYFN